MLSHSFRSGITTGYAKGTESSDMVESIRHLGRCAAQVMHPLLLPIIILSHDLSSKTDQKQRDARDWLRHLENAVSMRDEILENEGYVKHDVMDLDQINRDLVECHSQVLWKRPQAYQENIVGIECAMRRFWDMAESDPRYGGRGGEVDKLHRSMIARLDFYKAKLKGAEHYAHTTLERLNIQRAAVRPTLPKSSVIIEKSCRYCNVWESSTNTGVTYTSSTTSSLKKNPSSTSKWPANNAVSRTLASVTAPR